MDKISLPRIDPHYLLLTSVWAISAILVNPIGEFPLNDDWAYYRTLYELMQNGVFMPEFWVGVSLVSHLAWGSVFVYLFGFSFTILRISTLIMGLFGVLASYKMLNEFIKERKVSFLLSLLIAFNPVYFNLSFTFMTDLTFYVSVILSQYFYLRSFREGDRYSACAGTCFAIVATMVRQIGLFLPLSVLIIRILMHWRQDWRIIIKYALHAGTAALIIFAYFYWLEKTGRKPASYRQLDEFFQGGSIFLTIGTRAAVHTGRWLNENGLWLFPVIMGLGISSWRRFRKYLLPAGLVTVVVSAVVVFQGVRFPGGNIFYDFGLGPRTLTDHFLTHGAASSGTFPALIYLIRIVSMTGGIVLTWLIAVNVMESITRIRKGFEFVPLLKLLLALQIFIYYSVLLVSFSYFDRYGIIFYVPLVLLIMPLDGDRQMESRVPGWMIIAGICLFGIFSIGATHDYLSWNKARWKAARALTEAGVSPSRIDGGHEYNGWNGTVFDKYGKWDPANYEFVLAFGPAGGYDTVGREPWFEVLSLREKYIYVLKKSGTDLPQEP